MHAVDNRYSLLSMASDDVCTESSSGNGAVPAAAAAAAEVHRSACQASSTPPSTVHNTEYDVSESKQLLYQMHYYYLAVHLVISLQWLPMAST